MNTIALALLFLVRVLIPGTILIAIGEWVKHHEANYWLRL